LLFSLIRAHCGPDPSLACFTPDQMDKKCPRCSLNNRSGSRSCARCLLELQEVTTEPEPVRRAGLARRLVRRSVVLTLICVVTISAFYLSLILSARPLSAEERSHVETSIDILERAGFRTEAYYLRYYTFFRGNDNWLNTLVPKENAYAATNYPFEIMTLYPDFFVYTADDVERAAVLLHEARHLQGFNEEDAYEFVWKNKKRIGWTKANYGHSAVWQNVRKQTMDLKPGLFICGFNDYGDCHE
jgi:hypothetical protein